MASDPTRYAFGANWQSFVEHALNDRRVASAVGSLRNLLGIESLAGMSFLDVGCGSGLFSLAAALLESPRIVSFDLDPDSVRTTRTLRDRHGIAPERWEVLEGSVLDPALLERLEPADVVYAWGVLHHTGRMWCAIDCTVGKVRPGGRLALAIYNRVDRFPDRSAMWWRIKRFYNRAPLAVRRLMEWGYVSHFIATRLVTLRNPLAAMTDRAGEHRRGMDFWHDVRDWLGGFPYEYATAGEVFETLHARHGLALERLRTCEGNACNEFVFRRPA